MIIYSFNGLKTYETRSDKLNEDWTGLAEFIIDESDPEKQYLIDKVIQYVPYFDYVLDENGNLIDIIKTGDKPVYEPSPSPIELLQNENKRLNAKIQALTESNQFLEDCLVEMAEIVYA